jgi:methyl-accepting chemotaxis protein
MKMRSKLMLMGSILTIVPLLLVFISNWTLNEKIVSVVTQLSSIQSDASSATYEYDRQKNSDEINDLINKSSVILLTLVVVAGLASLFIWLVIANGIAMKIKGAVDFAQSIRQGDISKRMNSQDQDEMGDLAGILDTMANSLQKKVELATLIAEGDLSQNITISSDRDLFGKALRMMTENLHHTISQVKVTSEQVVAGTSEMSGASQSLSQGANEQAASLQEISSSVMELSSQTKTNAEHASEVNQLSHVAQAAAGKGTEQVSEMVGAMTAIQTSSKDIVKIIRVIDDIAFQTNLLALNAAVEAARAGKHGKGFAVVAEEVRNLAGRSAKAAKETSELITDSMGKVENGINVATGTVSALEQIQGSIEKVTTLIGEIAKSSNEQAQGIAQINQGLNQVEGVTQRNTTNAEQTAAASQELNSQAVHLRELMQNFKMQTEDLRRTPVKAKSIMPDMMLPQMPSPMALPKAKPPIMKTTLPPSTGAGVPAMKNTGLPTANKLPLANTGVQAKQVQPPVHPPIPTPPPKPAKAKPVDQKDSKKEDVWGKASPNANINNNKVAPESIIALDDNEFGKY